MNIFANKHLLIFLGGVALGIIGTKALKNEKFRQICLLGAAKGLKLKEELGTLVETLQEQAADFVAEAEAVAAAAKEAETEEGEVEAVPATVPAVVAKKPAAKRAAPRRRTATKRVKKAPAASKTATDADAAE